MADMSVIYRALKLKALRLSICLSVLLFSSGMPGLNYFTVKQTPVYAQDHKLAGRKNFSLYRTGHGKSDITFSRIDPVGDKCVMVYGTLSLGGHDFLIKDCGGPTWDKKWEGSIGYINRMFFQDEVSGWFVVSGALVRVKDSGNGFDLRIVRDNPGERISDVFFINEKTGWLCGANGTIYKTEDGGMTWEKKESGTDIYLKEIKFLNAREGWVWGSEFRNGQVISITSLTRDGGNSWISLNSVGSELSPVFFTSLNHGCGIDDDGVIVCTKDGQRWQADYLYKKNNKNAIFLLNERKGWIVGDCILHTENGGETWKKQLQQQPKPRHFFEQVVFINERFGWARSLTEICAQWMGEERGRMSRILG